MLGHDYEPVVECVFIVTSFLFNSYLVVYVALHDCYSLIAISNEVLIKKKLALEVLSTRK